MTIQNVTTPDFGGEEVTVIEVLVKAHDEINTETPIVTLESDKATMEVPAGIDGVVHAIKIKVGDKLKTGDLILTVDGKGSTTEKASAKKSTEKVEDKPVSNKTAENSPSEKKVEKSEENAESKTASLPEKHIFQGELQSSNDVHAGPGVRRLARELGINLAEIAGSGKKSRIIKEDVHCYVKARLQKSDPQTPALPVIDFSKFGAIETKPLSRIKKISGKNLQRNWMMIPHVTQFGEADITALEEFRQSRKEELEKQKIKLTPLVFIMKAVVGALKAYPNVNASLDAAGENLIIKNYFHLGVAVDTPEGLVVPVIRHVDQKGIFELAKELAEISQKARLKQLTPQDMQGGCFSISSLGGIGGTAFTPIINYPEVAILGVSKSSFKPVYQEGTFVPRLMLPLSLSYDHRVIDGAEGARFITHLSMLLSDIRNLLL